MIVDKITIRGLKIKAILLYKKIIVPIRIITIKLKTRLFPPKKLL